MLDPSSKLHFLPPPNIIRSPYFDMHKSDNGWMDSLKEKTHHCPLEAKCPFYQKMKEGKMEDIDWTATNCPMAEGW